MASIVRPDFLNAVKLKLEADAQVVALISAAGGWESGFSGNRVDIARGRGWKMPHYALILRSVSGTALGADADIFNNIVDVICYGATYDAALLLWRTVDPCLHPSPTTSTKSGFTLGNCRVYSISRERTASIELEPDQAGGWPRASCSYRITYAGVPA